MNFSKTRTMFSLAAPLCALALEGTACAPDLTTADEADGSGEESVDDGLDEGDETGDNEEGGEGSGGGEGGDPPGGDQIKHEQDSDDWLATVDATDHEKWIWLDVDSGAQVSESGGERWDLGFRRFEIQLNGGVNGNAGVAAAWLEGQNLNDVSEVPPEGAFVVDKEGEEEDKPVLAFGEWYDYDINTHVLTPKEGSYVVVSGEGHHYVIQIVDYYSETGTSGVMQYRWKKLEGDRE